jgi:hypothetical protein
VVSTQHEQRPEPVTPRARNDATAELGAEGGSYGDLTQEERAKDQSASIGAHGQSGGRVLLLAIAVAIFLAGILAAMFYAVGA